jgi:hypothetical protein
MMNHRKPVLAEAPKVDVDDDALFKDCLLQFGDSDLFADTEEWLSDDNPYRRTLRPHVFRYLDFSRPLGRDEILTYTSLTANRTLLTVYETDFMFLPRRDFAKKRADFEDFYSGSRKVLGEIIRPRLERFLFGFLDKEVEVTGGWTPAALTAYFEDYARSMHKDPEIRSMAAVRSSSDREHAAKTFLIQLAEDFLVESSPMSRNVLGHYGPLQSELFKIVVDEYGYGVHETKHSTLFETLMSSVGLDPSPHAYWQFYLTSSMLLNNYYNMICRDHSKFFRYIGAIFQAETAFIPYCRQAADTMRSVFGAGAEVRYFLEHVHIDHHHSKMVLDKLVKPAIERYGSAVIPDIIRGFEEAKLLGEIAEQDLCAQVSWSDGGEEFKALARPVYAKIQGGAINPPKQQFIEPRGELSVTHVHDGDELCHIESGVMKFVTGHERYTMLNPGEGTVIQRNRLHGAIIDSEECVYSIYSIGDHKKCLS